MQPNEYQNNDQQTDTNLQPVEPPQLDQSNLAEPTLPVINSVDYVAPINSELLVMQSENSSYQPDPIELQVAPSQPEINQPTENNVFASNPVIPTENNSTVDNVRITDSTSIESSNFPVKKKSKKLMIIGIIIASFMVVLGGGAVLGYTFWYSNPDKVVTDAIMNAIIAKTSIYKGNIVLDDKNNYKLAIDITAKQIDVSGSLDASLVFTKGGIDYKFNGSVLIDKVGDIYIKLGNLQSVAVEIKGMAMGLGSNSTAIDNLVAKINNKWIKISNDDLTGISSSYTKAKTCVSDSFKNFKNDNSAIAEITDLYKKNPLITIDKNLGSKNGSLGYSIKTNQEAAKTFDEGLKNTKIYSALKNCEDNPLGLNDNNNVNIAESILPDNSSSYSEIKNIELWVDSWTHQITNIVIAGQNNSGGTLSAEITPQYDQNFTIETPTSSLTLTEVIPDITAILMGSVQPDFDISNECPIELGEGVTCEIVDGEPSYGFSDSDI